MLIAQIPEMIENRPSKAFILLCKIGSYKVGKPAAAAKPVRIVTSIFQCVVFYDVCNFLELVSHHQSSTLHWAPLFEVENFNSLIPPLTSHPAGHGQMLFC